MNEFEKVVTAAVVELDDIKERNLAILREMMVKYGAKRNVKKGVFIIMQTEYKEEIFKTIKPIVDEELKEDVRIRLFDKMNLDLDALKQQLGI